MRKRSINRLQQDGHMDDRDVEHALWRLGGVLLEIAKGEGIKNEVVVSRMQRRHGSETDAKPR
jgi:hypothetical protein